MRRMHALLVFVGVAALLTLTPGPATAMVIRSALRGGRRHALATTLGNSVGILFWGTASAVGVSALVAASEAAFLVLRIGGAIVLVAMGIASLRRRGTPAEALEPVAEPSAARGFRDGLVTCLANVKVAVFFFAFFPQFVPSGAPMLPTALAMCLVIVVFDLAWYSTVALAVTRVRRAFVASPWPRRIERLTGGVLVGLGLRLALQSR
jgi:threonine/homoserine/homoserine lactone efflux protein